MVCAIKLSSIDRFLTVLHYQHSTGWAIVVAHLVADYKSGSHPDEDWTAVYYTHANVSLWRKKRHLLGDLNHLTLAM